MKLEEIVDAKLTIGYKNINQYWIKDKIFLQQLKLGSCLGLLTQGPEIGKVKYFCAHISLCKPCLNLNFLLLLFENAKDFYAIGYFDAKNAHSSQWAGQKKGLCCALRHLWQSSDARPRAWKHSNNFRHTCPNVSVTLSSSICDPMKLKKLFRKPFYLAFFDTVLGVRLWL